MDPSVPFRLLPTSDWTLLAPLVVLLQLMKSSCTSGIILSFSVGEGSSIILWSEFMIILAAAFLVTILRVRLCLLDMGVMDGDENLLLLLLLPSEFVSSSYNVNLLCYYYAYMYTQVSPKITTFRESAFTLITFEGFLPGVSPHVNFEGAWPHKLVLANSANVGSLARVPPLVVGQVALGGEAHIAVGEIALEGFLAVVNSHVRE